MVELRAKIISFNEATANPQMIIALALTIISVCALMVSVFQARVMQNQVNLMGEQSEVMRNQAKASVWPYLQIGVNKDLEKGEVKHYSLYISNQGTGPAIVKGVKVSSNGHVLKYWRELFDLLDPKGLLSHGIAQSNFNGKVIRAGEEVKILDLSNNLPLANVFFENADKIQIELCYRSVFEEYWSTKNPGVNWKWS